MASDPSSGMPKTLTKLTEQSPDLILEVESIAGDSDGGRGVESTTSESVTVETEKVGEEADLYAAETYYDDALAEELESESDSDCEQTTTNIADLSTNPDRPQRFTIKLLHDWCAANRVNIDLPTVKAETLDQILCRFYAEVRSKTGRRYSRNTIMAIRYGLNRYFANMKPPRKLDIIDGNEFRNSNAVFKTVVKNAARENPEKASPRISTGDLRKIYNGDVFSPNTPLTLLLKVWFEISVYFNKKRSKLQRETKITDFLFDVDNDGRRFATEVVNNDKKTQMFRMYEKVGDWMCPVASLEKLLTKVDPNCQYLFQRPRQVLNEGTTIWYHPERIGRNFASQMMGKISKLANLVDKYTNVSIKKLTAWSLEELVFQHRHLVKRGDNPQTESLMTNEIPSNVDGPSSLLRYSASRGTLPVPSTKSTACNTEDYRGAFRPFIRRQEQANTGRKGPEPLDVNTAKGKVKRIFQRLEYSDLVTLVDWLKRIDVLKDTSGTVLCRENCPRLVDLPESPRRFTPRQIQPLQSRRSTPFILPSPLSASQYLMNSAMANSTTEQLPAAIYLPNFFTTQTQSGVTITTPNSSRQKGNGIISPTKRSFQSFPSIPDVQYPKDAHVRSQQSVAIAQRQENFGLLCKKPTSNTSLPSQVTADNCVTAPCQNSLSTSATDSTLIQENGSLVTDGSPTEAMSPYKKLKISNVTGESKVWKIL